MKETKLHQEQLDVISNNNGLKMYLSGLSKGKASTPRSNLYNLPGKTKLLEPDEILAQWMEILRSLEKTGGFSKNVFQFDSHQLEKWGPQGGVPPIDDILDEIVYPTFSGSDNNPSAFGTQEWQQAKRNVAKLMHNAGCVGLAPVPYQRVVDDMRARDTLESNSGWPLFTRRNKPEVIKQSIEAAENGLWKTYPAIALFRNYNRKTRLVWMFPMSANLVEGSFFQPLQSILMKSDYLPAKRFLSPWTGFEAVREVVTGIYQHSHNMCWTIAASDFSSTDAHFQLRTSMEVYDVLASCFQERYRSALLESIQYMHTIPLLIGSDRMLTGEHGVSSGSNWTNFIETIFDWILSEYMSIITLGNRKVTWTRGLYAIGDDMTWFYEGFDSEFDDFLEEVGASVGQQIKAEKTTNHPDNVVSLQRYFQRGIVRPDGQICAVYSTVRALKSLVYPEKFHKPTLWSKDMEAIRAIMILENCVDHPLYTNFVEFVVAGDPYLVEFCKKSPSQQQKLFRRSKLMTGLNTTYNQEKRDSSIERFATVKFIREEL